MGTVALGDVALSLQDGPFGSNLKSSHYVDHGVRVVRLQNIGVGYFDDRDRAFVTEEHFARLRKHECHAGDVLIATLGDPIIRACRQPPWMQIALNKADCLRLRCDPDRIVPEYLVHFLNSDAMQSQAMGLAHGQTRSRVNLRQVRSVRVPLPPLAEQRRIADILDRADALRAKRRAVIAQLDSLTQSIFLDMFGDPVSNPNNWPETLLEDIADITSGITKGRDARGMATREVPYLAVANVQDRRLALDTVKTIDATEAEIERYALRFGDLLLTEGGDPDKLGRGALWSEEITECIHQNHIFRVRLHSAHIVRPLFLNWLVGSSRGKRYFLRSAKQTTGIASINKQQLRRFLVLIPPIALQDEFAVAVRMGHATGLSMLKSLSQLDALFASLQHRAFQDQL